VLIGGVTGVGQSTVATLLANRLGITRVVATDQVRQVVRAFFSHEFMPAVHHSSFDVAGALPTLAGDDAAVVAGFLRQVEDISPGINAIVERAVSERLPIVIEGVHLIPEVPDPELCRRAITARATMVVRNEEAHRAHFHLRSLSSPRPPGRYLGAFERIRTLQEHLIERAESAGIPIIDVGNVESSLKQVLEIVLDTVASQAGADADGAARAARSGDAANVPGTTR
jgi:2-phosphoglycerate kinase